jgi:coproporphyrinogen III oxidase-like Fe-S oxidoreductase
MFNEQRIEIGPWFEGGDKIDNNDSQKYLQEMNRKSNQHNKPYCIYIHIPFCPNKCNYCALYTFAVKENQKEIFDTYLDMIKISLATHPNAGRLQPPATVHFGGGTPLSIGLKRFSILVNLLRGAFSDSRECEWAIETTTSSINQHTITVLQELGVRRLHLGIQTLDNEIRKKIGRREPAKQAIKKINILQDSGFLLSVDLIIGFENSTEKILQHDLECLYENGIRIFSFCELRNLKRKEVDHDKTRQEAKRNFNFWTQTWNFMEQHQLKPIHLGQFARSYKDNLYYTHPARGENCLAIGPYAHGSANMMIYANKLLPDYYIELKQGRFPIDFAVLYRGEAIKIRRLESQLLSHHILKKSVNDVSTIYREKFENLWYSWLKQKLLLENIDDGTFTLSCQGSWFVGNMISQLRQLLNHSLRSNNGP